MSNSYDQPDDPTGLDQADELTIGAENDGVLEDAETLEDSPTGDPLDTGIIPTDRYYGADRFGTTEEEEEEGESLDQHLAEEEPDADPYAKAQAEDEEAETEGEYLEETDEADPRAGRLVAEDEGAHTDTEPDLVAGDVGIDAGAAGAEEAAVHVETEDEAERRYN
ncbi:MAG TPA: DUF5709 domain-containing protein [Streptosporangiaceae bacterium]|jgi:hypothetical protein|nr:DUF5709 domain-containing protein [Streptosporangiaceae bacterium]